MTMAMPDKHEEARELYIHKNTTCSAIAMELDIDVKNIYRWRKEDAQKGEGYDWDHLRRIHSVSIDEMKAIFAEGVGVAASKVKADPGMLLDPKFADAFSKIISAMQRIDLRSQYLSAITDLIKVANTWLAENRPELKKEMESCWDHIYQELVNYSTKKGVF